MRWGCWFCQHELSTETLAFLFVCFTFHGFSPGFIEYANCAEMTLWHFNFFFLKDLKFSNVNSSFLLSSIVLERVCLHLQLWYIERDWFKLQLLAFDIIQSFVTQSSLQSLSLLIRQLRAVIQLLKGQLYSGAFKTKLRN